MAKKNPPGNADLEAMYVQQMMNAFNPQNIFASGMGMPGTAPMPQAQVPQPPAPQRLFYVVLDGKQAGPFSTAELTQLAGQGSIRKDTLVWKQGMPMWQNAGAVPEISSFIPPAPPPGKPAPPPSAMPPTAVKKSWEDYHLPIDGILNELNPDREEDNSEEANANAAILEETLAEFKTEAKVTGIIRGPVVTMYEILPAPGIKLSKITALEDNIALRLAAQSMRILSPIPGKHAVGIEVPNKKREIVSFREIIKAGISSASEETLPLFLGKTISGELLTADLAAMPHLLVAGTTGSGKSVCINTMILSLAYKLSPAQCHMIFIDPKVVELKIYDRIPHLLTPVITEPARAFAALQYCVSEMEHRYAQLDRLGSRNIKSYNKLAAEKGEKTLPYLVVIIDEFADLMAVSGKETEAVIARLAAKSRAVGIHLVLATQRPSADVITGLIKSNIPARIAFMVAAMTDSRIIIDAPGAEKLLGKGDMLYSGTDTPFPVRAQGAYVSEDEAEKAAVHLRSLGKPEYIEL